MMMIGANGVGKLKVKDANEKVKMKKKSKHFSKELQIKVHSAAAFADKSLGKIRLEQK